MKYRSWDHDCWRNWLWWGSRKSCKLHALLLTTSSWRSSSAYLRYVGLDTVTFVSAAFETSTCERGARSKARSNARTHFPAQTRPRCVHAYWRPPVSGTPAQTSHTLNLTTSRSLMLALTTSPTNLEQEPSQPVRGWVQSTSYQRKSTLRWSSTEHLAFPCRELLDGEEIESVDCVEAR